MILPNGYWLKGASVYRRRDRLKKKYTFIDYTFSRDFIHTFVHWFFATNVPRRGSPNRADACSEARLLLDAVFLQGLCYKRALDRFCDLIKLDRMAWRVPMYRKAPGKSSERELELDTRHGLEPSTKSSRPYGSRFSRRLAGIPAEFGMNEACFGASKWSFIENS